MFVCGLFLCGVCVLLVIYCVALSAFVRVGARVCVWCCVFVCFVFCHLNVCCFVLSVVYGVRCCMVCV